MDRRRFFRDLKRENDRNIAAEVEAARRTPSGRADAEG